MSILVHHTMTNHHASGLLTQFGDTFRLWRERYRARQELGQWTDRELQDIGKTRSEVAYEVEKPFWRA